jgi:pyruvate/2-oxoglutarate dehydrogenase complex dihydrolipoamide dehydrogenase (E3) component
MAETLTPDICVIGAGPAGLSVAAGTAAFGVPVVLIEKASTAGGNLRSGALPSKALFAAAGRARAIARAGRFGVAAEGADADFARMRAHVGDVVAAVAPNNSSARLTALGVRMIEGEARFTAKDAVAVGDIAVKARRFVIATGASSALPEIEGLAQTPYLTPETVFETETLPAHLVVLGAGSIGLELGQAFRRLGSAVTVIDDQEPLSREDRECAAVVVAQLEREGIVIRGETTVARVSHAGGKIQVILRDASGEETIEASHLLVATGRSPNIGALDLDRAGIKHSPAGIRVNRGLRTSNRRVYAIGEAVNAPPYAHVAGYHAGLVVRNALFRLPARTDPDAVPRVVFTAPQIAQVGMTERQLRERRKPFRVLRWPYAENDGAQAECETVGHIKVMTARNGRILGAAIVGAQAGELINVWTLAIGQGVNIRALAGLVVPYPTLSEIGKRAAASFLAPRLTSSLLRRIMAFLRKLG